MGTRTALKGGPQPRFRARFVVGSALVAWGVVILLSALLAAGPPARETLVRTRGTVETLEPGRAALRFTLAGQQEPLRYLRRGGDTEGVRRLLEEARSAQVLLLYDPPSAVVWEIEGASGARRYEQVLAAWRDKGETDFGLGLALVFVGSSLVFGRHREAA